MIERMYNGPFSLRHLILRGALVACGAVVAGWIAWDVPGFTVVTAGIVSALILFFNALAAVSGPNPRMILIHGAIMAACLYLMAGIIIFCVAATLSASIAFKRVKDYPFVVTPAIEEYHLLHGTYPDRLAEIPGLPRAPRGISYEYWPDYGQRSYAFFFNAHSLGFRRYSGETRVWSPSD